MIVLKLRNITFEIVSLQTAPVYWGSEMQAGITEVNYFCHDFQNFDLIAFWRMQKILNEPWYILMEIHNLSFHKKFQIRSCIFRRKENATYISSVGYRRCRGVLFLWCALLTNSLFRRTWLSHKDLNKMLKISMITQRRIDYYFEMEMHTERRLYNFKAEDSKTAIKQMHSYQHQAV